MKRTVSTLIVIAGLGVMLTAFGAEQSALELPESSLDGIGNVERVPNDDENSLRIGLGTRSCSGTLLYSRTILTTKSCVEATDRGRSITIDLQPAGRRSAMILAIGRAPSYPYGEDMRVLVLDRSVARATSLLPSWLTGLLLLER